MSVNFHFILTKNFYSLRNIVIMEKLSNLELVTLAVSDDLFELGDKFREKNMDGSILKFLLENQTYLEKEFELKLRIQIFRLHKSISENYIVSQTNDTPTSYQSESASNSPQQGSKLRLNYIIFYY